MSNLINEPFDFELSSLSESTGHSEPQSQLKKFWSDDEDKKLNEVVQYFIGIFSEKKINWIEVERHLPGRTSQQCRKRWHYKLNPQKKCDIWTKEDDDLILKLQQTLGNKWSQIGKHLDGRNDLKVKNRFFALQRKMKNEEELLDCINTVGPTLDPSLNLPAVTMSATYMTTINQPQQLPMQFSHVHQFYDESFQNIRFPGDAYANQPFTSNPIPHSHYYSQTQSNQYDYNMPKLSIPNNMNISYESDTDSEYIDGSTSSTGHTIHLSSSLTNLAELAECSNSLKRKFETE